MNLIPVRKAQRSGFKLAAESSKGCLRFRKKHVNHLGLEWNDTKAQRTAKEAYDRLFNLKWTPPGRGLWMMGTKFVEERTGAGLFNCSFRSTNEIRHQRRLSIPLDYGCSYAWRGCWL